MGAGGLFVRLGVPGVVLLLALYLLAPAFLEAPFISAYHHGIISGERVEQIDEIFLPAWLLEHQWPAYDHLLGQEQACLRWLWPSAASDVE